MFVGLFQVTLFMVACICHIAGLAPVTFILHLKVKSGLLVAWSMFTAITLQFAMQQYRAAKA